MARTRSSKKQIMKIRKPRTERFKKSVNCKTLPLITRLQCCFSITHLINLCVRLLLLLVIIYQMRFFWLSDCSVYVYSSSNDAVLCSNINVDNVIFICLFTSVHCSHCECILLLSVLSVFSIFTILSLLYYTTTIIIITITIITIIIIFSLSQLLILFSVYISFNLFSFTVM